jgi:hypothetical protein
MHVGSTGLSTALWTLALVLALTATVGCTSSALVAPAPPSPPSPAALEGISRIVIVPSRESRFATVQAKQGPDLAIDKILMWLPYKEILIPIAHLVQAGITWLLEADAVARTGRPDVVPAAVVADAFARALQVSGRVDHIVTVDREPVGDVRRRAEAIVRLTVPSWGLVRVRDGDPPVASAFADVRVQVVLRETGVVLWEHEEDVTHPGRLSLEALKADQALTRELLTDVLERAGRRLANELIYLRSGAT